MMQSLLQWIGIGDEMTSQWQHVQWAWSRPLAGVIGVLLLLPLGWFIVRRHHRALPHMSPRVRHVLSACRIGVLLIVVLILAGPYLRLEQSIVRKPIVALLLDDSSSMQLPAGPIDADRLRDFGTAIGLTETSAAGPPPLSPQQAEAVQAMTRGQMLQQIIETPTIQQLADRFELRWYTLGRDVRTAERTAALSFRAGESALGTGIERAMLDAADHPIAAIVLLSDGRSTIGPPPVLAAAPPDRSGASQPAVFPIVLGSNRPMTDAAILEVIGPEDMALKDSVQLTATLQTQQLDDKVLRITLSEGDRTIDEKTLVARTGPPQQVTLRYEATEGGVRSLQVRVQPVEGETLTDNNQMNHWIHVTREPIKVLLIEGWPRWDFRFLDHALRGDKSLDASIIMESQADESATPPPLPTSADEWAAYHIVVLGDVSPSLLTPQVAESLVAAVRDKGLGLLIACGTESMPQGFADSPLAALMPLELESPPTMEAEAFAPFRLHVSAAGALHPAFSLEADAARNRTLWAEMPQFYWSIRAKRPRPAATVLAEVQMADGRLPLIAEQFHGRGRVLMLGMDSTFRWRRNVGDRYFYRFWGQALRHLARKPQRSDTASWIAATPTRVEPSGLVGIELYALDSKGTPIQQPSVPITLRTDSAQQTVQLHRSEADGLYRGSYRAETAGLVRMEYASPGGGMVTAQVCVADSGRELLHTTADRAILRTLADRTGGRMLEPYELAELPKLLQGETKEIRRVHEEEVWDNWLTLLLLVVLYCTDVAVRRLTGMN